MANWQILNHKGEVLVASISKEELDKLTEGEDGLTYSLYDDSDENNLIERYKTAESEGVDMSDIRIIKEIIE